MSASVTRTIGGNWVETVGAAVDRTIGADESVTVGGNVTQTVAGGITTSTPGTLSVTTGGSAIFIAPAGFTLSAPGGFHNIDGEWVKFGGLEKDAFVVKSAELINKTEMCAVSVSLCGSRNSAVVAKAGYLGIEFGSGVEGHENEIIEKCDGGLFVEVASGHSEG